MRGSCAATVALVAALGLAAPASAQRADQEQAGWQGRTETDRGVIMDFLIRPEVSDAAAGVGIDLQEVGRGVMRMDAADAAVVADRVRDVEQQMAADTITITTTTLIIGLLVLIVLILVLG